MAATFFLVAASTCVCLGISSYRESLLSTILLVTVWGTGYLLVRIANAPSVALRLRAQLVVSTLLCVGGTVVATWIFFDWPYQKGRTVVRPYPPLLYFAATVAVLAGRGSRRSSGASAAPRTARTRRETSARKEQP